MVGKIFAVRDVNIYVIKELKKYAAENNLNIADALTELVTYALKHMKEHTPKKKYNSFFEVYDKVKFKGGPNLASEIDEVLYGREMP